MTPKHSNVCHQSDEVGRFLLQIQELLEFNQLSSNLVTENLATNLWFWQKAHVLLAFKSGVRAVRQIYTGNIWEKSRL